MPFYIALLGNYNMIIRYKQFEYFKVDLAILDRQLIWPKSLPPIYFFDKLIKVTCKSLAPIYIDPKNQANAIYRDRALDKEIDSLIPLTSITKLPRRALQKLTLGRHNHKDKQQRLYQNIQASLKGKLILTYPDLTRLAKETGSSPRSIPKKRPKIDLFEISIVAYQLISKKDSYVTFTTSLNKLDSLILDYQASD